MSFGAMSFCAMFFCVCTFINCILIVSLCDCHTHSLKATWLDLTWVLRRVGWRSAHMTPAMCCRRRMFASPQLLSSFHWRSAASDDAFACQSSAFDRNSEGRRLKIGDIIGVTHPLWKISGYATDVIINHHYRDETATCQFHQPMCWCRVARPVWSAVVPWTVPVHRRLVAVFLSMTVPPTPPIHSTQKLRLRRVYIVTYDYFLWNRAVIRRRQKAAKQC